MILFYYCIFVDKYKVESAVFFSNLKYLKCEESTYRWNDNKILKAGHRKAGIRLLSILLKALQLYSHIAML